ncbi:MAG: hypothetical protein DMG72_00840 [Acidobacteria bacterium]|nr:MAG: hypothetical protein DMG72_00840 [Acidobacteriota bacterium]
MGTSSRPLTSPEPEAPLAHLSDEALIRRYCAACAAATTDEDAAQELWHHRHEPIVLQKIKYIAARPGNIRPDFVDFKPFVDASLSWAWQKYFGGIRGLDNPGPRPALLAWLEQVAYTSCMTEQRKILTRGPRPVPLEDVVGGDVPTEEYETEKERGPRYTPRPDLAERQPSPPVHIAGKERKFIVRELLIRHAQSSERARESAHFVRLRHWNDWKCPRIARHYCGEPADVMQKKADDHRVWSRLNTDHEKLRKLLKKEFDVSSLRQI